MRRLAYIKPATQCEGEDLLGQWCASMGVACVAGANAPLVFFKGFTREFLAGRAGTSREWLSKIGEAVDSLARGKSFVIVDGVGFPAVGSVVGVDNAEVAIASRAPVVLVGKCGVGAAIDAFSLNASFFQAKGVPVIGAVFNRGDLTGFYDYRECAEAIGSWFTMNRRREQVFGVIPELEVLDGARERVGNGSLDGPAASHAAATNIAHVKAHVDVQALVLAAACDPWNRPVGGSPPAALSSSASGAAPAVASGVPLAARSRAQVEAAAASKGAKGG